VARRNFTDTLLRSSMVFSEFDLVNIYLPDGTLVPLPHPLGSPEGERLACCMIYCLRPFRECAALTCDVESLRGNVFLQTIHFISNLKTPFPQNYHPGSCEAALPILKHLSEMSYRPKDLVQRALKEYMAGGCFALSVLLTPVVFKCNML